MEPDLPAYVNDPFHQAFVLLVSRREDFAAKARSAERRGDDERARAFRASAADLDEAFAVVKRLLQHNPGRTRELFEDSLKYAKQNGLDGGMAAAVAFHMLASLGQTKEGSDRHADLAGWIESSRIAPIQEDPDKELELRLWNQRALSVEEEHELWRQGMSPMDIARRVFPHRQTLIKGGGRALSIHAQVEYANEMARRSDPNYDPIALRRRLYPDTDEAASPAVEVTVPAEVTESLRDTSPSTCTEAKCRMCRLILGDPEQTRVRLREVLDLIDQGYHSTTIHVRWNVSPSTVRDWARAARHRRDLGTL